MLSLELASRAAYFTLLLLLLLLMAFLWFNIESGVMEKSKTNNLCIIGILQMFECDLHVTKWKK